MNKSEKTVVTAFINEVFKRSLEILKNMQAGSEDILAVSSRLKLIFDLHSNTFEHIFFNFSPI